MLKKEKAKSWALDSQMEQCARALNKSSLVHWDKYIPLKIKYQKYDQGDIFLKEEIA